MAKAMGCNTIATYIFWNYHEAEEGKFDFSQATITCRNSSK
jgi:beta-galactosidase